MRKKAIFIIISLLLLSIDAQAQCAMCRAVLESEASQTSAKGINDGIMYLMIFPYLLIGGVAYFIWRTKKKSEQE